MFDIIQTRLCFANDKNEHITLANRFGQAAPRGEAASNELFLSWCEAVSHRAPYWALLEEAAVVDYPHDLALSVIAKHLEDTELYSCEAISAVRTCLESVGLALAEENTKAILITKRWKQNYTRVRIGNHIITSKRTIKYLGIMIDTKLSFKQRMLVTKDPRRAWPWQG